MKCPLCNTEAKIQKSVNVLKGDKLFRRMTFVCRNSSCKQYEKAVGMKDLEQPIVFEDEPLLDATKEEHEEVVEETTEENPIMEGEENGN